MSAMAPELTIALSPVLDVLNDQDTEDLAFNGPGVGWRLAHGRWERIDAPAMTLGRLRGVATMAAAGTRQNINKRSPLLSTELPSGHRLQVVLPPAVPDGSISLTFRRPSDDIASLESVTSRFRTAGWNDWTKRGDGGARGAAELLHCYDAGDVTGFLRGLAETRRSPLFCGATGAGKTGLLKTFLSLLPTEARVITIEDALEAVLRQANVVRLQYAANGIGGVSQAALLKASLRMRPDYIVCGEMRDPDAALSYVNECMTGHPGAPATAHGQTAAAAARRLFNLVKGSEDGRSMSDASVTALLVSCVDVIMPIGNLGGSRSLDAVWFADDARRRGETFADLLRAA